MVARDSRPSPGKTVWDDGGLSEVYADYRDVGLRAVCGEESRLPADVSDLGESLAEKARAANPHGLDWWDDPPEGSLPLRQNRSLVSILRDHTTTSECCWFALWYGFNRYEHSAPTLEMPARPMWLFSGAINASLPQQEHDIWEQSASLWWPQDHAWCVATDVDLESTYVGGTEACISSIMGSTDLETIRVSPDDPLA